MRSQSQRRLELIWLYRESISEYCESVSREPSVSVSAFSLDRLRQPQDAPSAIEQIEPLIAAVNAVVIEWDLEASAQISVLRTRSLSGKVPFLAFDPTGGSDIQEIARLMWADDVLTSIPTVRLIRSVIQSHRRALTFERESRNRPTAQSFPGKLIEYGPIKLDDKSHRIIINDREIDTTPLRFQLLRFFLLHPDEMLTRDKLMSNVWGIDFDRASKEMARVSRTG